MQRDMKCFIEQHHEYAFRTKASSNTASAETYRLLNVFPEDLHHREKNPPDLEH